MPERRLRLREVEKKLEAAGFGFVRQEGSHQIWQRYLGGRRRVVVVPCKPVIPIGTLSHIRRQAGLTWDEFDAL